MKKPTTDTTTETIKAGRKPAPTPNHTVRNRITTAVASETHLVRPRNSAQVQACSEMFISPWTWGAVASACWSAMGSSKKESGFRRLLYRGLRAAQVRGASSASVEAFQHRTCKGGDVERLARQVFPAPHDDHLTAGHDHHILTPVAEGGEGVGGHALGAVHQPEGRAIAEVARRRLRPGRSEIGRAHV